MTTEKTTVEYSCEAYKGGQPFYDAVLGEALAKSGSAVYRRFITPWKPLALPVTVAQEDELSPTEGQLPLLEEDPEHQLTPARRIALMRDEFRHNARPYLDALIASEKSFWINEVTQQMKADGVIPEGLGHRPGNLIRRDPYFISHFEKSPEDTTNPKYVAKRQGA